MEAAGFICIAVIVVAIIFGNGILNEKKFKNAYRDKLIQRYGEKADRKYKDGEFEHICGYEKEHADDFRIDEITWSDLDMDAVYKQMNYCKCSAGEEYLYYRLRHPRIKEYHFDRMEEVTEYFRKNETDRLKLQLALHEMGYTGKYSMYDYLNNLDTLGERNNKKDILVDLLFIPAAGMLFWQIGYGIALIFVLILYNLITYFKEKSIIEPYITCFAYVFRVLNEVDAIKAVPCSCIDEEKEKLLFYKKKFGKFKRFSSLIMSKSRMTGNPTEIIIDYARMFFHLDIIKFNSMLNEVKKHTEDIDMLLTIMGKLDFYLAIGEYRTYLHEYSIPVFSKQEYQIQGLYHPLLETPVKNDIMIKKSILFTGSNASGKSTMLKAIAVNALLAQSVHTVAADSYHADYFRIYTSLSLKDNIFEGDSYYMAEIRAMKRIIDASEDTRTPLICFVDEVLRGTNTVERIAASTMILKTLSAIHGYCFAATHDIELTDILKHYYENYHFEEEMNQEDIHFSYCLHPGKATTRNAIKLLDVMGYGSQITRNANLLAEQFEQNGIWQVLERQA